MRFLQDVKILIDIFRKIEARDLPKFLTYVLLLPLKRLFGIAFIENLSLKIAHTRFLIKAYNGDLGFVAEVNCRRTYEITHDFVSKPGDVCVDVGANIGCFSLQCIQTNKTGKIIAVEPHPETFLRLVKNLKMNRADNVVPIQAAIADKSGKVKLTIEPGCNMARVSNSYDHASSAEIDVPGLTLDDLTRRENLRKIDLLKIDVEGGEVKCLLGARNALRHTHRIVLEAHSEQLRNRVIQILSDADFKLNEEGSLIYGINSNFR